MKRVFTTKEIAMDCYNATHYRIEVDNTDHQRPLQRHWWKRKDNGKWEAEEWIKSIRFDEESNLRKGWSRVMITSVSLEDYSQL